jgi:hypothetical protein
MEFTLAISVIWLIGFAALAYIVYDFTQYLFLGRRFDAPLKHIVECLAFAVPALIFLWDLGLENSCCEETAAFSPSHRLSVLAIALLNLVAYFYSAYRKRVASPLIEIVVNCCLLLGIPLMVFLCIQLQDKIVWFIIWLPVTLLLILALAENHKLAVESLRDQEKEDKGFLEICRKIVLLPAFVKFPLLVILCLPVLLLLLSILLLFGQKPDSIVRAFTDTYKHGFSQLNHQCDGVVCGGHFLCTVAAKGHSDFVKPLRSGIRGGRPITCNRQLLVANAFEELLEQRLPGLHRPIRALYNKIGDFIHRYYGVFNNKWVADLVYVVMKPLEWIFVVILYAADRKPENRIAQQYMDWNDRKALAKSNN